ncbi:MAG TPA: accessory factor UbiK family protein [Chiayiivirga sp.]|nr:accessory factor UbiK family protein [Chiayiivirga sp.]
MESRQLADELAHRLGALLPESLGEARAALEERFRSELRAALRSLDPVSREEFELQRALLLRTRARLEALEYALALRADDAKPGREASRPGGAFRTSACAR